MTEQAIKQRIATIERQIIDLYQNGTWERFLSENEHLNQKYNELRSKIGLPNMTPGEFYINWKKSC